MFKLVRLQVYAALVGMVCGALISGLHGAVSAAVGGLSYALASGLFAWYLQRANSRGRSASLMSLFFGEAVKIALVVILLILVSHYYGALDWKSLILGLGVTLQANFLAFFLIF